MGGSRAHLLAVPGSIVALLCWGMLVGLQAPTGDLFVTSAQWGEHCLWDCQCRVVLRENLVQASCELLPVGCWARGQGPTPSPVCLPEGRKGQAPLAALG